MKAYKFLTNGVLLTLLSVLLFSCSDDSPTDPTDSTGESYIKFSVSGSAVNGAYNIQVSEENDKTIGIGTVINIETDEGTKKVVSLVYTDWETADEYTEVHLVLPAHTGALALGEIKTGTTGIINEYPTFYMTLRFKSQDAFYDRDGDGDNDLLTNLLSKTVSATITDIEESQNNFGILTLIHIKGSFEGTAEFKAYTGPASDPEELLHTVSGEFEYNIPVK